MPTFVHNFKETTSIAATYIFESTHSNFKEYFVKWNYSDATLGVKLNTQRKTPMKTAKKVRLWKIEKSPRRIEIPVENIYILLKTEKRPLRIVKRRMRIAKHLRKIAKFP